MARHRTLVETVEADPTLSQADRQQILDFAAYLRFESERRRNSIGGATEAGAAPAEKKTNE